MDYLEFSGADYSAWKKKAIAELKEKSFDETLMWLIENRIKIDAYASSYLASPEELAAIQQVQKITKKCNFVTPAELLPDDSISTAPQVSSVHNVLEELLSLLVKFNKYLEQDANLSNSNSDNDSVSIRISLQTNYLLTLAKVRALRFLIFRLAEMYNKTVNVIFIGTTDTHAYRTDNEHINIVRATTMAMAGIAGGCTELEIIPFDQKDTEFSNRIARNILHILANEAYFTEVADPAAGSFFIENLTYALITDVWGQFVTSGQT